MTDYLELLLLEQREEEEEPAAFSTPRPVAVEKKTQGEETGAGEGTDKGEKRWEVLRLAGGGPLWRTGPAQAEETADLEGEERAEKEGRAVPTLPSLYSALRRTSQAADRVSGKQEAAPALPQAQPAEQGLTLSALDRQMEVDARRYDGGFRLY